MILDPAGVPVQKQQRKAEMIESVATFGYDLDIKDDNGKSVFEKAKFFRSHKFRCKPEDEDEASREAWEWCVDEVMTDIRDFQERQARKRAAKQARSAKGREAA